MFKRAMVADSFSDSHITPCRRETSPLLPMVFCFAQSIGAQGGGVGQFDHPCDLALTPDQTQVIVADKVNKRLVALDAANGQPVSHNTTTSEMPDPFGVVIVLCLIIFFCKSLYLVIQVSDSNDNN